MTHGSGRTARDDWMDDNTRGLSLAAVAEWDEAAEAFAAAADVVARRTADATSHDALGLVLSNLAQACFRAGRTREALAHAQRACAIRVALVGEDAMPVARARMDLAVMLGSLGRLDEAQALVQRAIASVELHAGDEDVRLITMLENAARLALAAGAPANAEPMLLRLHALLHAHGMPTTHADRLLEVVAQIRAGTEVAPVASYTPAAVPMVELLPVEASFDEWDDEPLRDAVAMTEVLLRTTPSDGMVIPDLVERDADVMAAFEQIVLTPLEPLTDLIDEAESVPVSMMLELADDFDMVDVVDRAVFVSVHTGESAPEVDALPADAMSSALDDAFADSLFGFAPPVISRVTESDDLAPESFDLITESDDLAPELFDLVPESFDLAPESFDLVPESFDLAPESFDLAPESFDLAPESFDLAPESFERVPEVITELNEAQTAPLHPADWQEPSMAPDIGAPDIGAPGPTPQVRAAADSAPSGAAATLADEARPSTPRARTLPADRRSSSRRATPPRFTVARIAAAVTVAAAAGAAAWYFLLR